MLLKGWEAGGICFSNQLLTHVRNGSMTYLWSNLMFLFSHASFPLKYLHFPSALLIWSKSLNWVFLLGWVNYMKEHNNFDPVPTINTNPCLKHSCQQAQLHTCDTMLAENFQKEQHIWEIRVHLWANIPHSHCTGCSLWRHPIGGFAHRATYSWPLCKWCMKHPSLSSIFMQFKPNSTKLNKNVCFPCPLKVFCIGGP